MGNHFKQIQEQIVCALSHPEAEEGLYFNNLIVVHEDEERPIVAGSEEEIRATLEQMLKNGEITAEGYGEKTIYKIEA